MSSVGILPVAIVSGAPKTNSLLRKVGSDQLRISRKVIGQWVSMVDDGDIYHQECESRTHHSIVQQAWGSAMPFAENIQMHATASSAHPTIAKRHHLDEYNRGLVWHVEQSSQ